MRVGGWIARRRNRRRRLIAVDDIKFKGFRRLMDTYGQELGFSLVQVSIRAGHDPAVASKHYTGKIGSTDRALAAAIGQLIQANPANQQDASENRISE